MKFFLIYLIIFLFLPSIVQAHTFIGMVGFFDGISHPVLGLDHFLAMISVGIISAQIGGKAIWEIPATFVLIMIIGGIIGIFSELNVMNVTDLSAKTNFDEIFKTFISYLYIVIEIGIIFSVIFLGLSISIEKKLPVVFIMFFVGIFGFFHGTAHGLEMPQATNPIFFALGFATGTATLHIFGLMIGYFAIGTKTTSLLLRAIGICFAFFGIYSLFLL